MAFPDALRFILAVKNSGIRVAAASSSKNAKLFLERIRLDTFAAEQRLDYGFVHDGMTLEELFDADISGRDFPRGKPDPMIFLTAAEELGLSPEVCFVVEDATSGVQAAKAGGFAAIGVARLGDEQQLADAGADLVVTTLDDISLPTLIEGRLEERQAAEEIRRRYTERPPNVWTLVYDGYDPERQGLARGAVCAGQRLLRYSWRATRGQSRRRQLPGNLRSRPLQPADQRRSQVGRWRTRTWSTSPTGSRCNFASPVVPGSTCSNPASKTTTLNSIWSMERSSAVLPGKTPQGRRTKVVQRRFVSREDEHLAGLETEFTAENWSGSIQVRSGLDGRIVNAGVKRYRDLNGQHLTTLGQTEVDSETVDLQVETNQSHVRVALAARTQAAARWRDCRG